MVCRSRARKGWALGPPHTLQLCGKDFQPLPGLPGEAEAAKGQGQGASASLGVLSCFVRPSGFHLALLVCVSHFFASESSKSLNFYPVPARSPCWAADAGLALQSPVREIPVAAVVNPQAGGSKQQGLLLPHCRSPKSKIRVSAGSAPSGGSEAASGLGVSPSCCWLPAILGAPWLVDTSLQPRLCF